MSKQASSINSNEILIYSLQEDYIWSGLVVLLSLSSIVVIFLVVDKKKQLRNVFLNTSYCKISDYILNMVGLNMIAYVVDNVWIMITMYGVAHQADQPDYQSRAFKDFKDSLKMNYVLYYLTKLISLT